MTRKNPEIEAMRAELDGPDEELPPQQGEGLPADDPPPDMGDAEAVSREGLVRVLTGTTAVIGGVICRRAMVTALEPVEAQAIGQALADLLAAYGLDRDLDPRATAWLAVGMALVGTVSNRRRLAPVMPPPPPAEDPPPAAPDTGPPPAYPSRFEDGPGNFSNG